MTEPQAEIRVAVDLVVFSVQKGVLKVLLVRLLKSPFSGLWGLPGGLIHPSERLDEAAVRELREKTGLADVYMEQLYTFSDPKRDPSHRCISVAHMALLPPKTVALHKTEKYAGIEWFTLPELGTLGYDHKEIIETAVARLRSKLSYTNIAYSLLADEFTQTELQRTYEAILGRGLDVRNFRRKIAEIGLIQPTGQSRQAESGRPARLYRFTERKPVVIQVL